MNGNFFFCSLSCWVMVVVGKRGFNKQQLKRSDSSPSGLATARSTEPHNKIKRISRSYIYSGGTENNVERIIIISHLNIKIIPNIANLSHIGLAVLYMT